MSRSARSKGGKIGYTVRGYEATDEPAVLALLNAALVAGPAGAITADFLRWKHERNPFGRSAALVADVGGRTVGYRTFMRWRFTAGPRVVTAVRAVDTATHPEFQGQGIFRELTLAGLDRLPPEADLVFNTPNDRSRPGYLKMGWQAVGIVPAAIRPLRPRRTLVGVRRAAGWDATPPCRLPPAASVLADGAAVSALLEATASTPLLRTERSVEYLRWRYADAPGLGYRGIAVVDGEQISGLAIGRPRWRGKLAEFTLSEVIVRAGDRRAARRLLREVARRADTGHVASHFPAGSDVASAARRSGYLTLRRRGLTLVANPLRVVDPNPLELASWAFSLGDLEVF